MKINFFAPINYLGYGTHAHQTMLALDKLGHSLTLTTPNDRTEFMDEYVRKWLQEAEVFDPKNPSVMIFHEQHLTRFCGTPRIGFPVFETDQFLPWQLAGLRSCDQLFTPSEWGKNVLASYGLGSQVVREGYDPEVFYPVDRNIPENQPVTFLHVGKFEERKGTLQTIRCFYEALERCDAVLIMHIENRFVKDYEPVWALLRKLNFKPNEPLHDVWRNGGLVIKFTGFTTEIHKVAKMMREADCGLYPSKAEGWGLPILETLACGTPCVVGRWTGQSEYLPENYPKELQLSGERVTADDGVWFAGDRGSWVRPFDNTFIEKIRWAFSNVRKLRGEERWRNISEHIRGFTWQRAAGELVSAVESG